MAKLNRIKAVLAEQDKTSKWLAEQVGKSACTVSKWCSNSIQPDLTTLDKISKLLNVSIKDLLIDNRESLE
jgi:transcriptional regulator with XRE-family HTH domain